MFRSYDHVLCHLLHTRASTLSCYAVMKNVIVIPCTGTSYFKMEIILSSSATRNLPRIPVYGSNVWLSFEKTRSCSFSVWKATVSCVSFSTLTTLHIFYCPNSVQMPVLHRPLLSVHTRSVQVVSSCVEVALIEFNDSVTCAPQLLSAPLLWPQYPSFPPADSKTGWTRQVVGGELVVMIAMVISGQFASVWTPVHFGVCGEKRRYSWHSWIICDLCLFEHHRTVSSCFHLTQTEIFSWDKNVDMDVFASSSTTVVCG